MSPLNVIFSSDVCGAFLFVFIAGLAEPVLADRVNHWLEGNSVLHWAWDHLAAPMLRAAIIAGFVLLAYPALFALSVAPGIGELAAGGSLRLTNLFNVLFLVSLVLPALPLFGRHKALIIPVQGLIAVAMVFGWLTEHLGATSASFWPGWPAAVATLAMALVSHRLAADCGSALGHWLDRRRAYAGFDRVVPNSMELLWQTPVLLYYALSVSRQIGI